MDRNKTIKAGKFISLVLRHDPTRIGITLDAAGYAPVDKLLAGLEAAGMSLTITELLNLVENNDKSRYSFNQNLTLIRANQGHSIDVDLGLKPVLPPQFLYHGTAIQFVNQICKHGINRGERNHVHLSSDQDVAVSVGKRHGKPFVLTINAEKMYEDGHHFYMSENGVWLVDFVDYQYVTKITDPLE